MFRFLAVVAFALAMFHSLPAQAQSANLSGEWRGAFVYTSGERQNQAAEFQLELAQTGNRVTGTTTEVNTFGNAESLFLLATIQGSVSHTQITFEKTYDGTGGQTHTVSYAGTIMPGGRRIVGTWSIGGATLGQFEMVR